MCRLLIFPLGIVSYLTLSHNRSRRDSGVIRLLSHACFGFVTSLTYDILNTIYP